MKKLFIASIEIEMAVVAGTAAEACRVAHRHLREEVSNVSTKDFTAKIATCMPDGWGADCPPYGEEGSGSAGNKRDVVWWLDNMAQQNKTKQAVTIHSCPPRCDAGGPEDQYGHNFSVPFEEEGWGGARCSKCGLSNIEFDMMRGCHEH